MSVAREAGPRVRFHSGFCIKEKKTRARFPILPPLPSNGKLYRKGTRAARSFAPRVHRKNVIAQAGAKIIDERRSRTDGYGYFDLDERAEGKEKERAVSYDDGRVSTLRKKMFPRYTFVLR